jgi:hypothetical protein
VTTPNQTDPRAVELVQAAEATIRQLQSEASPVMASVVQELLDHLPAGLVGEQPTPDDDLAARLRSLCADYTYDGADPNKTGRHGLTDAGLKHTVPIYELLDVLSAAGSTVPTPDDAATEFDGSWFDSPHRVAVDAKGYVWRVYPEGVIPGAYGECWSMAPTNPDNSPVPEPVIYYVPERQYQAARTRANRNAQKGDEWMLRAVAAEAALAAAVGGDLVQPGVNTVGAESTLGAETSIRGDLPAPTDELPLSCNCRFHIHDHWQCSRDCGCDGPQAGWQWRAALRAAAVSGDLPTENDTAAAEKCTGYASQIKHRDAGPCDCSVPRGHLEKHECEHGWTWQTGTSGAVNARPGVLPEQPQPDQEQK